MIYPPVSRPHGLLHVNEDLWLCLITEICVTLSGVVPLL